MWIETLIKWSRLLFHCTRFRLISLHFVHRHWAASTNTSSHDHALHIHHYQRSNITSRLCTHVHPLPRPNRGHEKSYWKNLPQHHGTNESIIFVCCSLVHECAMTPTLSGSPPSKRIIWMKCKPLVDAEEPWPWGSTSYDYHLLQYIRYASVVRAGGAVVHLINWILDDWGRADEVRTYHGTVGT